MESSSGDGEGNIKAHPPGPRVTRRPVRMEDDVAGLGRQGFAPCGAANKGLTWLILVRFRQDEKPRIETLSHRLGLRGLSSTIRAVTLAACRQESSPLFDCEVRSTDSDRTEQILAEMKSLREAIQELKSTASIGRSIRHSDVVTRALAVLLDPANRRDISQCLTEKELEEYLVHKDPLLKGELTRESEGIIPLDTVLTTLHVRAAIKWKERIRAIEWNLDCLKSLSDEFAQHALVRTNLGETLSSSKL